MKVPVLRGRIARRVLINYRIDPDLLQCHLPSPFRPLLVGSYGVASICILRLEELRPRHIPRVCGLSSDNLAHRFAVSWGDGGQRHSGVYIPRRETGAWVNSFLGDRLFPGVLQRARFACEDTATRVRIRCDSNDGETAVEAAGQVTALWPAGSLFGSLNEAVEFFSSGSVGYSDGDAPGQFDGMELKSAAWRVEALSMKTIESTYFSKRFPKDALILDCALLMRDIVHEWHAQPRLFAR